MALPKKNSRPIIVDGKIYRWQFSDCYRSETNDHSISVVVQLEHGGGSKWANVRHAHFSLNRRGSCAPAWFRHLSVGLSSLAGILNQAVKIFK